MSDHSITSLIEKLEAASEGSREIDGLIYANEHGLELNGCTFILEINGYETFQFKHPTLMHPNGPAALYEPGHKVPEVSTSLDAALAQAERVLDGDCSYELFHDFGGFNRAKVHGITNAPVWGEGKAETIPLALCIAVLRAQSETRV